jgi:arabinofuranosyltransferase
VNLNPNTSDNRRLPWLIWTAVALLLLGLHGLSFRFVIDDAFISFRYARNLVDGHGLVFNPGEKVEGYSNLLYVLLSAVGMKLNAAPLLWGRIWSTLAMGGLLAFLPGIVRLLAPEENDHRPLPGHVAQMVLAAVGAVACWMLAGLETAFFAFFAVWAWRSAIKRQTIMTGIAGLLLVLTRPEGPALAAIFMGWALLPGRALTSVRSSRLQTWLGPAILILGTASFFLWRHAYFGYWLPNTYYAKTGDLAGQLKTGWPYGLNFLIYYGAALLAAGAAAVLRGGTSILRTRDTLFSFGVVVFWFTYTVIIGGDMLGMFRFFVPVLPIFTTTVVTLLSGTGWLSRPRGAVLTALALMIVLLPASLVGRERRLVSIHMSEANLGGWILAGDAMARQLPRSTTIALGPAGYIPYITGFKTWDFYGIIEPSIAHQEVPFTQGYAGHEKHDGPYIVSLRPDYILIGNVDITDEPRQGLIPPHVRELDIVRNKSFQMEYEQIYLPVKGGKYLNMFRRKR